LSHPTGLATLARIMRTRTRTLGASLLAGFALAAGGSLAGAAAPADAHYLSSTTWSKWKHGDTHLNDFRFPPRNLEFKPCITRTVTLRSGYWDHDAYIVSERRRNDPDISTDEWPLYVPTTGAYHWKACREWTYDREPADGNYVVTSRLSRSNRQVGISMQDLDDVHRHDTNDKGDYEWGGRLAPAQFPGGR
jgi:hypothetical protein